LIPLRLEAGILPRLDLNMNIKISKAGRICGALEVPGDKSIAHRALILGALAEGTQIIEGLPRSLDVDRTAACLRELGTDIVSTSSSSTMITRRKWRNGRILQAGNSGTTARLLAGLLAGHALSGTIDGDHSLRVRPMERLAEPLLRMGADIRLAEGGHLPLWIRSRALTGATCRLPVASAQVKSAVLIAGLQAAGTTTVVETFPTRDHTEIMLEAMAVPLDRRGTSVSVSGGVRPRAIRVRVPGDLSAAVYFMAAALCLPNSELVVKNVGLNPTRTGFLDILQEMGADLSVETRRHGGGEPAGEIKVRSSLLRGVDIGGVMIPRLIDELPLLAVLATQAEGVTTVREAGELRYKESDRITSIVRGLAAMGAKIEETPDGFIVQGPVRLAGAAVSSAGDHRIAMALATAGLLADGDTTIENSGVIDVSYPGFLEDVKSLVSW